MQVSDKLIAVRGNHEKYLLDGLQVNVHDDKRNISLEEIQNHKWIHSRISEQSINFAQLAIPYNVNKVIKEIKKLKFPFYEGILKIFYGDRN